MTKKHINLQSIVSTLAAALITCGAQAQVNLEAARDNAISGGALVIDIREPIEHATGVAKGIKLMPMSTLGQRLGEIPKDANKPVLLICNTQNRSRAVASELKSRGYTNVQYVNGGMSEWTKRGWPMQAPSKP